MLKQLKHSIACLNCYSSPRHVQDRSYTVYVGLKTNKPGNFTTRNHYVGQVVAVEEEVDIKYVKKTGSSFIWPVGEDTAWTSRDEIHLFFSIPEIDRRQHFTLMTLIK